MRLKIEHETIYHYGSPVIHSLQLLRLTPRSDRRQRVLRWRLNLPTEAMEHVDAYGNISHLLTMEGPHQDIHIGVEGVADTSEREGEPDAEFGGVSPQVFLRETPLTAVDDCVRNFALGGSEDIASQPISALVELTERIQEAVRYGKGTTEVQTTAAEVLSQGSGVCQDHSHLFIACCKALGVPARYVSGYFHSGHDAEQEIAMHAWAEAWIEGQGWLSYDISNAYPEGAAHLRLAVGRDYLDTCPVRGVRYGGGHERMQVRVQVMAAQRQQEQQQQ
jgi:transglutaminase-like putative cysteine protease